jgi:hypothetical protein
MSSQRYISTSFWDDEWIQTLKPMEKYLFVYLLSNPLTHISGVYKITDRRICFDTGLNQSTVKGMMEKFDAARKAFRMGEYIVIPTHPKHQKWEKCPKIKEGIIKWLMGIGIENLNKLCEYGYRFDLKIVYERLSIPYPYDRAKLPGKEDEPHLNRETEAPSVETVIQQAARTGFFIDAELAEKLLAEIDPSWLGEDHSFISFVAIKIREHKKYQNKPIEEQRRIFRKVLIDAENYRQEYPFWREAQEKLFKQEKQRLEREAIRENKPKICQCGAEFNGSLECSKCGGRMYFDTEKWKWAFSPKQTESLSEGYLRRLKNRHSAD